MKIDLNPSASPELVKGSSSATIGKPAQTSPIGSAGQDGDIASLSTGSDSVASLRTQLHAVPDVRQDRVQALRQAISQGQFVASPTRIAAGMLADALSSY